MTLRLKKSKSARIPQILIPVGVSLIFKHAFNCVLSRVSELK